MDRFIAPDARIIDADVDYAALAAQDPVWAPPPQRQLRASRRQFIKGVIASGTAVSALSYTMGVRSARAQGPAPERLISINVNGQVRRADVTANETLAMTLRYKLGLTGTKLGCDRGECGACTVIIDGRNMYSCSQLAVWMQGKQILTIEGLATRGDKLDPLQDAFIEHDGPQCGFCTSGQIMSGKALLMKNPKPTEAQVRRALSGNLCRCGNYNREVAAVLAAASKAS